MLVQIVLIIFLLFSVSRVFLQLKHGNIKLTEFAFWTLIFCGAIVGVVKPELTIAIARLMGIGRGADAVIYFSIVLLFYLIFRLYIFIENLHHEMTDIISHLALKEDKKIKKKK